MQPVTITFENPEFSNTLADTVQKVLPQIESEASGLLDSTGVSPLRIRIRVTDRFREDVQSLRRRTDLPEYTTERVGGVAAAIVLRPEVAGADRIVLLNASVFTKPGSWALGYLPATIAHEVSHCLIDACRDSCGAPSGYCDTPMSLLDTVGYTALTACDEYLADEVAKRLLPPIGLQILTDDGELAATDRALNASDRLASMIDELDLHVFPILRDRVQTYRETGLDLDGMTRDLVGGIQSALILGAHYRSATAGLDGSLDEAGAVARHPATELYIEPFWSQVAPPIDERIAADPLARFAAADQEVFDIASAGVTECWASLGVTLEKTPDGVFVHVDEPSGL